MQFDSADIDTMLELTGEDVTIILTGLHVKTIKGKFRKNFLSVSPYEIESGTLSPMVTVKTADLEGIGSNHSFIIQDTEYKYDGKPEDQPSGITIIKLGIKK